MGAIGKEIGAIGKTGNDIGTNGTNVTNQSYHWENPEHMLWLPRPVGAHACKHFSFPTHKLRIIHSVAQRSVTFEPPRGKTNNVVSEQVWHKPACTATEAG